MFSSNNCVTSATKKNTMEFTIKNFRPLLIKKLPDSKLHIFLTETGFKLNSLDMLEIVDDFRLCGTVEQLKECDQRWYWIASAYMRERSRNTFQKVFDQMENLTASMEKLAATSQDSSKFSAKKHNKNLIFRPAGFTLSDGWMDGWNTSQKGLDKTEDVKASDEKLATTSKESQMTSQVRPFNFSMSVASDGKLATTSQESQVTSFNSSMGDLSNAINFG